MSGAVTHGGRQGGDHGGVEPLTGVASLVDLPAVCASCGAAVEGAKWPELRAWLEAAGSGEERECGPMVLHPCGHELAGGA